MTYNNMTSMTLFDMICNKRLLKEEISNSSKKWWKEIVMYKLLKFNIQI